MRRGARASIMYIMHVNGCRREEAREGRENWAEAASVYLAGITFEKKKAELLMGRRGWLLIDNLFGWRNFKLKMNLKLKSKLHKSWRDIIKFYLHLFTKKRLIVCAQYFMIFCSKKVEEQQKREKDYRHIGKRCRHQTAHAPMRQQCTLRMHQWKRKACAHAPIKKSEAPCPLPTIRPDVQEKCTLEYVNGFVNGCYLIIITSRLIIN